MAKIPGFEAKKIPPWGGIVDDRKSQSINRAIAPQQAHRATKGGR
jgi:hypothetical protein